MGVLVLALAGGLVVAVYSDDILSGTESSPTAVALRQRAEAASEAASSASLRDHAFDAWEDVYRFMTPEFRKTCNSGHFAIQFWANLGFGRAHALGRRLAGNADLGYSDYSHNGGYVNRCVNNIMRRPPQR